MDSTTKERRIRRGILIMSIGLLAISLTQKCYCTDSSTCGDSVIVFFLGALSIMGITVGCFSGLCWLANPALIMAWIFLKKKPQLSFYFSCASLALSLLFFFLRSEWSFETGSCHEIDTFSAGYWLWVSSSLVTLAGSRILSSVRKNK